MEHEPIAGLEKMEDHDVEGGWVTPITEEDRGIFT
jgi:hypothetical protein